MRSTPASFRGVQAPVDRVGHLVSRLQGEWLAGKADLRHLWDGLGPDRSVSDLAVLVKADLRCRFTRGERPAVADYLRLDWFPNVDDHAERMLSLIYEEFCLLEERGDRPDVTAFCERYAPWKHSIISQLRYHSLLSQVAGTAATPPNFPATGEQFQQFVLGKVIGRGASAQVYRARDVSLGDREVALKIYPDRGIEAAILGRLEHAHIVPVHSTTIHDETKLRGLCMPFRAGVSLEDVIKRAAPARRPASALDLWNALCDPGSPDVIMPWPDRPEGPGWAKFPSRGTYADGVAWVVAKLALALDHAHSREIQHRDVKPANVLMTFRDGPQLLDFNLAFDRHSAEQAEAALRGGTLPYMAPEQLDAFLDPEKWQAVGPRADIYSLGLVLRELLTGQTPDLPNPELPIPRAIRDMLDRRIDPPAPMNGLNPRLPHALDAIVARCLAFAPGNRYSTGGELSQDLQRYLERRPLRYAQNAHARERASNWMRRNRVLLVAALLAGTFLVVMNWERWLYRVEERPTFLRGVAEVNDNQYVKAIRTFEIVEADGPRSPIVLLYHTYAELEASIVALRAEKNAREEAKFNALGVVPLPEKKALVVADRLAVIWGESNAETVLAGWAKGHPEVGNMLLAIGQAAYEAGEDRANPGAEQAVIAADRCFALMLRIIPNNFDAKLSLAVMAEKAKRYDRAISIINDTLNGVVDPDSDMGKDQSKLCLYQRSRVSILWGEGLIESGKSAEILTAAGSLFKRSLDDLDRAEKFAEKLDAITDKHPIPDFPSHVKHFQSHALAGLADIAIARGHPDEAAVSLREARRMLDTLEPIDGKKNFYLSISQKVTDRLRLVESKTTK